MVSSGFLFDPANRRLPLRLFAGLFTVLVFFLTAALARSQNNQEGRKSQDEAITLKTHLVTLDVIVKDNKGKYVTDIKPEDFSIYENGARQVIEFFDPPRAGGNETNRGTVSDTSTSVKSSGGPTNILSIVLDGATT